MSYIVRSGIVTSVSELLGDEMQNYAYSTVRVDDQIAVAPESEEILATTTYIVMVFGVSAIMLIELFKAGHQPEVVVAGRFLTRRLQSEDGSAYDQHEITAEHIGLSLHDTRLRELIL